MQNTLIKPLLKDQALLDSIKQASTQKDRLNLWWLGQSGYLVQWQGKHLLLDPYLSDSLTVKYAQTEKPHTRMTERVVDPASLDFIDIVTSSHNHTDHLDGETLVPLIKVNPDIKFIIPEANRGFIADRIKSDTDFPIGLNDNETVNIHGFNFTAVPAAHENVDRDEAGRCKYLGYVIEFGPHTIYHSGDTMLYGGMVEILSQFSIDVALLPINGRDPARKVAGNLNGKQAAELGKSIGAKTVIPCHYDMFSFNTADPAEFAADCEMIGQNYVVLQTGEHWSTEA